MNEIKDKDKPFQDIEFKSLKLVFKSILIILFIVLSLLLVFSVKTIAISQDINYNFDIEYIYNSNEGFVYDSFNIRNQTIIFQDNYTSTYDFLDDDIGSTPNGWNVDESGGHINITSSYKGHNRVIEMFDNSGNSVILTNDHIINRANGTIEFWLSITDSTKSIYFPIIDGSTDDAIYLYITSGKLTYVNGGSHDIIDVVNNALYRTKIDFECSNDGYLGLSSKTFLITINGVQYGAYSMKGNPVELDVWEFTTGSTHSYFSVYIDAIGYSWDNDYTIGQNIAFPEITTTDIQEIDKCEFAYNLTTFESNGLDLKNIDNNWIENDDATNSHVKTSGAYDEIEIGYYMTQDQDQYGIYKEFDYNNDGIFNISFSITSMDLYNPKLDGWYFNIYSYDDTLLVSILFEMNVGLDVYYYDGSNYINIHNMDSYFNFFFNIYINNRVILRLNDDGNSYVWYFPELTTNIGINTIEIIGGHKDDIGDYAHLTLDSVGFYINGSSYLPDDLSSMIINTDIEQWNDNIHKVFKITGIGNFSFSVFYGGTIQDVIIPYSEFIGTLKRVYYTDSNIFKGSEPYKLVLVSNESISISEITISANPVIKEGVNIYYPSFTYSNVNITENYFYSLNNKLYFTHNSDNTEVLEYIQVSFNIDNEYCLNASINYNTKFIGISKGYFLLEYVSTLIDVFEMPLSTENINTILSQEQIISKFTFLITDNNNSDYLGNSEGYFSSIKLNFIPNIEITLLTITLIEIMIPLMVLILPSIIISGILGKKAIIPMLILMTIICYIAELIELGLFTIIMMCLGSLIIVQYKIKKD